MISRIKNIFEFLFNKREEVEEQKEMVVPLVGQWFILMLDDEIIRPVRVKAIQSGHVVYAFPPFNDRLDFLQKVTRPVKEFTDIYRLASEKEAEELSHKYLW